MEFIQTYWFLISFTIGAVLGLISWGKARELKETKLQHEQVVSALKTENKQLMASQKHDSDYNRMFEIISAVEREMRLLRDKASERHGEIQGRVGTMQLELKVFNAKYATQIDELYRVVGGRRNDDMKATN